MGRFAEAQQQLRQALQLDPFSTTLTFGLGNSFRMQHQYDQAIAEFKKVVNMEANNAQAHLFLCWVYRGKSMYDQAAPEVETYYRLSGFPEIAEAERKAYAGWKGLLVKDIAFTSNPDDRMTYFPPGVAWDYAEQGDKDKAFAWLERAYNEHAGLEWLKVEPGFDSIRSDPRFKDLLHRIGYPNKHPFIIYGELQALSVVDTSVLHSNSLAIRELERY